jgi:hypothetical protein
MRTTVIRPLPLAAVVVLSACAVAWGGVAPAAAANTVCNPVSQRFEVREAGAGIGLLHVRTNICTSGKKLASASGSVVWEPNPLGSAAGWRYQGLGTSRLALGSTSASWKTSGTFKLCVPTQVSPLCSYGESFSVTYAGYAKSFIGPTAPPRFSCSNTYCSRAMTFVYKGRD